MNSAREDHNKSLVRLMNEGESKQMLDEYKRATLQLLQLKDDLPTTAEVLEPWLPNKVIKMFQESLQSFILQIIRR